MPQLAGWATNPLTRDGLAHQVKAADSPSRGPAAYETYCGRFHGSEGWASAGPAVERCQACQSVAAGSAD
ncbi:hypothetical protein ABIE44_001532 [Marmoricola sp. OAE513]|uniref:hypothetical protein n=1 Tax=Marmoricola sp. OAE513 TaxID=2817894 RepID=UPI001AEA570B